jgi:hypothetical protein
LTRWTRYFVALTLLDFFPNDIQTCPSTKLNASWIRIFFAARQHYSEVLAASGPNSEGNHAWLSRLRVTYPSPRMAVSQPQSNDLFRPPAASRIDDASHTCVGMKPNAQIGSAWKKQVAPPVCLSQESRGFGLGDNKRSNPGLGAASQRH